MNPTRFDVANNPRATVDVLWSDLPSQFIRAMQVTLNEIYIVEGETVEVQFRFKLEDGELTAEQYGTYRILGPDPYGSDNELLGPEEPCL